MRVLDGPAPGEERAYAPPVPGESFRVIIRTPSERQKRAIWKLIKTQPDADGAPVPVHVDVDDQDGWKHKVITAHVVRVEDYCHPGGQPISDASALLEFAPLEVLELVAAEILTAFSLTTVEKKTYAASLPTTPAETPVSHGTAVNAAGNGSAPRAGAPVLPPSRPLSSPGLEVS